MKQKHWKLMQKKEHKTIGDKVRNMCKLWNFGNRNRWKTWEKADKITRREKNINKERRRNHRKQKGKEKHKKKTKEKKRKHKEPSKPTYRKTKTRKRERDKGIKTMWKRWKKEGVDLLFLASSLRSLRLLARTPEVKERVVEEKGCAFVQCLKFRFQFVHLCTHSKKYKNMMVLTWRTGEQVKKRRNRENEKMKKAENMWSGCVGVGVGVWVCGCVGVSVSRCLGVSVSRCLSVLVSRCLGVSVSRCLAWGGGRSGVEVRGRQWRRQKYFISGVVAHWLLITWNMI